MHPDTRFSKSARGFSPEPRQQPPVCSCVTFGGFARRIDFSVREMRRSNPLGRGSGPAAGRLLRRVEYKLEFRFAETDLAHEPCHVLCCLPRTFRSNDGRRFSERPQAAGRAAPHETNLAIQRACPPNGSPAEQQAARSPPMHPDTRLLKARGGSAAEPRQQPPVCSCGLLGGQPIASPSGSVHNKALTRRLAATLA